MTLDQYGGWPAILSTLIDGNDLDEATATAVLGAILDGAATDAQIAAFIVAIRQKGETVGELTGLVRAMLAAAEPLTLPENTIDIVGTGGAASRQAHALNVSTFAAFVAAGAGATVCKHGNRKASSTSGSFDVLEALGVNIEVTPTQLEATVSEIGLGFAFARTFHPAMRHVGPVRAELGIKTAFNVLGPLSHPGRLRRQVVGIADAAMAERMIGVLAATGSVHAMVVTGHGPLDELSTAGPSTIVQLRDGVITTQEVDPVALGLALVDAGLLAGGDAAANAEIAEAIFAGEDRPAREIVALNAAAGLVVAGVSDSLADGLSKAFESLDSGAAAAKLEALRAAS
ncbi:MAG: anthranilate phosphoribosyltransferase [Acidobacteria bacterium]|nr:anthranilate phosphoribosyltransferase [Acidobacteriota bacterium]